jgi:8-oxo-dGTP diphosphatase
VTKATADASTEPDQYGRRVLPPVHCGRCGGRLGAERPHPVCTACGATAFRDPKVGVGAVVQDDAGRVLLVRRGVDPGRGLWALPAGYVDADEDPRNAAAREVREETGLRVEVGRLLDVHAGTGGGASFFLSFAATVVAGELVAGDDALDVVFADLDALPELAFASTRAAVASARVDVLCGQWVRAVAGGEPALVDHLVVDEFVGHWPGGDVRGPAALADAVQREPAPLAAGPALDGAPVVAGDRVALRWTGEGVRDGRAVRLVGHDLLRLESGRVAEHWPATAVLRD